MSDWESETAERRRSCRLHEEALKASQKHSEVVWRDEDSERFHLQLFWFYRDGCWTSGVHPPCFLTNRLLVVPQQLRIKARQHVGFKIIIVLFSDRNIVQTRKGWVSHTGKQVNKVHFCEAMHKIKCDFSKPGYSKWPKCLPVIGSNIQQSARLQQEK